jgi:hypothetical protein
VANACDTFHDQGDCTGEGLHAIRDPWGFAYMHLCDPCKRRLDNYEPPDPDGEAFRGGEAAAYENEQLHRLQRERRR